jgi:uncharacterized damage-inducible protein DinB
MHKADLITLYDYNYWANARILDAAAQVTPDQYCALANLSHGSLRATLVHTFVAELVWRSRCQSGISLPALPTQSEYPTLEILRAHWLDEEGKMRLYLASLTDESIYTPVHYVTTSGVPYSNVLWNLLVHVVNHGTQSRAEAGLALASYGHSPGDLDMVLFFRERESQAGF